MTRCCWTILRIIAVSGLASCSLNLSNSQPAGSQILSIELSPGITIVNDHGTFRREWDTTKISPEYNSFRIIAVDADHLNDQKPQPEQKLVHDIISANDVLALVRALRAPLMRSPSLSNLGITRTWLAAHADDVAMHSGALGEPNDQNQQEFIRKSFVDLDLIKRIIPQVIGASWTDDYASIHVSVRFTNGEILTAETTSQSAFMLPWERRVGGRTTRTYNADLSRAVAKLLPDGTVYRQRLLGNGLAEQIKRQMPGSIKQKWQEIGAEDKAGDALVRLREKYSVRRSEVSVVNDEYFGSAPSGSDALQADVRLGSFPPNLVIATIFPMIGGKAVGVESFLHDGSRYERIVLDNPWVMASLRKHTDRGAWLIYAKDVSMSDKAMSIFAADMHSLGRDDLAQEVFAHRKEVAVLSYFFNVFILFPDHHAIIWRWDTSLNLFSWKSSAITTNRCTDFDTLNQGCSAAVVGPDGTLKRR